MEGRKQSQQETEQKSDCEILGIPEGSSPAEIRTAYRKKVLETHPDVGGRGGPDKAFRDVNEAYIKIMKELEAKGKASGAIDPIVAEALRRYQEVGGMGESGQGGSKEQADPFAKYDPDNDIDIEV